MYGRTSRAEKRPAIQTPIVTAGFIYEPGDLAKGTDHPEDDQSERQRDPYVGYSPAADVIADNSASARKHERKSSNQLSGKLLHPAPGYVSKTPAGFGALLRNAGALGEQHNRTSRDRSACSCGSYLR